MQKSQDRDKIMVDMVNSARFVQAHALSNKKLGVTGFCFGGAVSNHLAVELSASLQAAAPFYGTPAPLEKSTQIKAKMLVHYAENDPRVNASRDAYQAALKAAKVEHAIHTYAATHHGFHNNSTPRYNEAAAKLAWERTLALFKETLT